MSFDAKMIFSRVTYLYLQCCLVLNFNLMYLASLTSSLYLLYHFVPSVNATHPHHVMMLPVCKIDSWLGKQKPKLQPSGKISFVYILLQY